MWISIEVSDEIQVEAASNGMTVLGFIESLIQRGIASTDDRSSVATAVDRIRALRKPEIAGHSFGSHASESAAR